MELPTDKKYNIIYLDPPWTYDDECSSGERGAIFKYPLMTFEELMKLPVESIADKDCVLFMWVTMPLLNDIFESGIIKHWGFTYKTNAFVWIKKNKNSIGWFWGMGNWTRSNAELCLLSTKGNPKRLDAGVHSIIDTCIEEHSKKPNETRRRIVQLCGDLPRIELFSRQRVPGWTVWGSEVGTHYTVEEKNPFFES